MIKEVNFEHDGRKYESTVETQRGSAGQARWWFSVTGDQQRYAPIEAVSSDTQSSVKSRVIAFYKQHLFIRSQPPAARGHFGQRGRPPAAIKALQAENAAADAAGQ